MQPKAIVPQPIQPKTIVPQPIVSSCSYIVANKYNLRRHLSVFLISGMLSEKIACIFRQSEDFNDIPDSAFIELMLLCKTFNDYASIIKCTKPYANTLKHFAGGNMSTLYDALAFVDMNVLQKYPENSIIWCQDKCWAFDFYGKEGEDDIHVSSIVLSTYKNNPPSVQQPTVKNNILTITMKQAGLLAVTILNRLIRDAYYAFSIIITPLAGAIFSKEDIRAMAVELTVRAYNLIININASCQSGGQHLQESRGYLAVVSAICSTRNMRKEEARLLAIGRTVKQYLHAKKVIDHDSYR